ncbi:MAG: metallopeptidase family protein [Candidatus Pacebacteria bacterium]|nr:metallopeptidase family protein [Candidatus Paceibacterota bacterium]
MDNKEFEQIVKRGIAAIPEKFLTRIENVAIVIEDNPDSEQLKKLKVGRGFVLFGLYEGIPKTKRWGYSQVLPDKITIFKNQIEKYASSEPEIERIVKETVWHEIAHYFGMDEDQVRAAEGRRRKNKKST